METFTPYPNLFFLSPDFLPVVDTYQKRVGFVFGQLARLPRAAAPLFSLFKKVCNQNIQFRRAKLGYISHLIYSREILYTISSRIDGGKKRE